MVQHFQKKPGPVPDDSQNGVFYPRPVLLQSKWLKMVLQKQFELIVLVSLNPELTHYHITEIINLPAIADLLFSKADIKVGFWA